MCISQRIRQCWYRFTYQPQYSILLKVFTISCRAGDTSQIAFSSSRSLFAHIPTYASLTVITPLTECIGINIVLISPFVPFIIYPLLRHSLSYSLIYPQPMKQQSPISIRSLLTSSDTTPLHGALLTPLTTPITHYLATLRIPISQECCCNIVLYLHLFQVRPILQIFFPALMQHIMSIAFFTPSTIIASLLTSSLQTLFIILNAFSTPPRSVSIIPTLIHKSLTQLGVLSLALRWQTLHSYDTRVHSERISLMTESRRNRSFLLASHLLILFKLNSSKLRYFLKNARIVLFQGRLLSSRVVQQRRVFQIFEVKFGVRLSSMSRSINLVRNCLSSERIGDYKNDYTEP